MSCTSTLTCTFPASCCDTLKQVADICLIPLGTADPSVSKYVAEAQRVLEKSGLVYKMHGYGTGIEGEFSDVTKVIEEMHEAVHKLGVMRIASGAFQFDNIRLGTRLDKPSTLDAKMASVEKLLAFVVAHPPAFFNAITYLSLYLLTFHTAKTRKMRSKVKLRLRGRQRGVAEELEQREALSYVAGV
ncbi:hypothetical protein JCM11641_003592 [Rhodosporidiobolus odoratus]